MGRRKPVEPKSRKSAKKAEIADDVESMSEDEIAPPARVPVLEAKIRMPTKVAALPKPTMVNKPAAPIAMSVESIDDFDDFEDRNYIQSSPAFVGERRTSAAAMMHARERAKQAKSPKKPTPLKKGPTKGLPVSASQSTLDVFVGGKPLEEIQEAEEEAQSQEQAEEELIREHSQQLSDILFDARNQVHIFTFSKNNFLLIFY
jgi:hypothetical protein